MYSAYAYCSLLKIAVKKDRKIEYPFLYRAHDIIVHNLSYTFDVYLDMRIIKFVYYALNHYNEICHNLLHAK